MALVAGLIAPEIAYAQPANTITVPVATTVTLSPTTLNLTATILGPIGMTLDQALNTNTGCRRNRLESDRHWACERNRHNVRELLLRLHRRLRVCGQYA